MLSVVIIVFTYGTRACKITAIHTVKSRITLAESIGTDSMVTTVTSTTVNIKDPHVSQDKIGWGRVVGTIADTSMSDKHVVFFDIGTGVVGSRSRRFPL